MARELDEDELIGSWSLVGDELATADWTSSAPFRPGCLLLHWPAGRGGAAIGDTAAGGARRPAGAVGLIMMSVITGRYHVVAGLSGARCGRLMVTLPGAVRAGAPLCQGGGEVDRGRGQGEQVSGDGGEGGPKLHWCRSNRWRVVRGGRSVLTLPGCDGQGRGDRAPTCALRLAGASRLATRRFVGAERTPGARRRTPSAL